METPDSSVAGKNASMSVASIAAANVVFFVTWDTATSSSPGDRTTAVAVRGQECARAIAMATRGGRYAVGSRPIGTPAAPVQVFSVTDGAAIRTTTSERESIALSADGKSLARVSGDKIVILDVDSGAQASELAGSADVLGPAQPEARPTAMALSPDGTIAAAARSSRSSGCPTGRSSRSSTGRAPSRPPPFLPTERPWPSRRQPASAFTVCRLPALPAARGRAGTPPR
jgi:hypothetical protein